MCQLIADAQGVTFNALNAKREALQRATNLQIPVWIPRRRRKVWRFSGRASVVGKIFQHKNGREAREVTDRDYNRAMELLFETDLLFELMLPMPGVVEAFDRLSEGGKREIAVASSCSGLTSERFWRLANRHGLQVHHFESHVPRDQRPELYRLGRIAVDDEAPNLMGLEQHPDTLPFLMLSGERQERPPELPKRIRDANGWESLTSQVIEQRLLAA